MNVFIKLIRVSISIFLLVFLIPGEGVAQINDFRKEIEFVGKEKNKGKAIQVVDKSLKKHGNLEVQVDLSVGLSELSRNNYITITEKSNYYHVIIAPDSEGRHDYCLKVDKNTLEVFDLVIGEVVPEPERVDEF